MSALTAAEERDWLDLLRRVIAAGVTFAEIEQLLATETKPRMRAGLLAGIAEAQQQDQREGQ